jgi:DNA (cytosine-5)-methyltransferase 1
MGREGLTVRYGSVCSGIEAATVAWHPLGWQAAWYSEIEPFPCAVLKHHYPHVPNYGDMTKFEEWPNEPVDLLVGGTPCQSFSVAGLRKGLADPRGNLMLTYLAIAQRHRPRWLVWENVPGVLSSNGGRDFGTFLGALGELGYGFAYRVLDAQWFGVAQRRRRVFVVGYLGDWRRAAEVLFESESVSRHPAPSREARKDVAGTIAARFGISRNNHEECVATTLQARMGSGGADFETETLPVVASTLQAHDGSKWGSNQWIDEGKAIISFHNRQDPVLSKDATNALGAKDNGLGVAYGIPGNWIGRAPENGGNAVEPMLDVSPCQTKTDIHAVAHTLRAQHDASEDGTGRGTPLVPVAFSAKDYGADASSIAPTLRAMGHGDSHANGGGQVAVAQPICTDMRGHGDGLTAPTLRAKETANDFAPMVTQTAMQVRRLTPVECERLQGFPDSYTNIPWRKKDESPDGPRYKALGNSMAVPVMRWIGERIAKVDAK